MESGEVVENQPIILKMPFTFDLKQIIQGDLESVAIAVDSAAEEGLKVLMPQIFEYHGRLSQAAGTATDAGGEKLSHRLILQSLDKMDISFDAAGNPEMPTMVMSPDMAVQLGRLPPPTEQEVNAFNELIERKRREFNDRKRHRKLS